MKIQAIHIQTGDRIIAYCNNKMQICRVKHIVDPELNNISLSVSVSESSRNSLSRIIRFQRDAVVELYAKACTQDEFGSCVLEEPMVHSVDPIVS
ncbi:hypothetical protein K9N68_02625 [Kovacikia minuta CCNUW1]|uniref:hypothetical protein n=1 Tax=Kovacikia minuta TaxID=2931930 RepID=UPI001CCB3522|nr:hypothetical protein [Kovacikia minuta]UBF26901.1 hypothetical protein K9N68_02625 [Kovacikia minuta CCNUW1]